MCQVWALDGRGEICIRGEQYGKFWILPSSVQTGNLIWNWTELALISINPATRPPARNSSEIAGIWINLLYNINRATQEDLKSALKKFEVVFQPEYPKVIFQFNFFLNSFE